MGGCGSKEAGDAYKASDSGDIEAKDTPRTSNGSSAGIQEAWMQFHQKDVFEDYEKERELGEGMTGKVYQLIHKQTRSRYAGKSVVKGRMNTALLGDLKNEISVLKALDHPNVVKLYEVYEDEKQMYLVMELCTGGELYDALINQLKGNYSENDAAHLFYQMVAAVNYVHTQKLAHRDLKLENFIFESPITQDNPRPPLKLIDFGLSHRAKGNGIQKMKSVVGTPYYIAPEVLQSQAPSKKNAIYTEKCDIWSLGVLLYMLLSGEPPFSGADDREIMAAVVKGKFSTSGALWDRVSRDAKELLAICLEPNQVKRQPASEVLKHPWLERRHNVGKPVDASQALSGVAKSLQGFGALSKLKKTCINLIAFSMTPDQIKDLTEAFKACDDNGDGVLTLEEFRNGMTGKIAADQIEKVFRSVDTDNSGTIQYSEFLAAALSKEKYSQMDKLKAAWDRLDTDGNGYLDSNDFMQMDVIKSMYSEDELRQMIDEADIEKDGKIEWAEFLEIMQKADSKDEAAAQ